MPNYQYECRDCDYEFEKRQRFSDPPLTICPSCDGSVERVISPVGIIFKGPGFYITDSKNGKNGKKAVVNGATNGQTNGSDSSDSSDNGKEKTDTPADTNTTKEAPKAEKPKTETSKASTTG